MKTKFSTVLIAVIIITLTSLGTNAQVIEKKSKPINAYASEFLGAEIGIGIGTLVATGLLVGWSHQMSISNGIEGRILGIGLLGAIALTPALSGYLLHRNGKKYKPNGQLEKALIGSYIGAVVASGLSLVAHPGHELSGGELLVGYLGFAFIQGGIGVLYYNVFPRKSSSKMNLSLIQKSPHGWNPGIPSLSIMPHPVISGKFSTQISLFNVTF